VFLAACSEAGPIAPGSRSADLDRLFLRAGVVPLQATPAAPAPLVALGRALFFDKVLSGNHNIGCSTCHNPIYHTSDQLPLSIGTGGNRPGGGRQLGSGEFTMRGAPDLFDRANPAWHALFWDGRVEVVGGSLHSPAGAALPAGLSGPLAAQALFPLLARVEMRGQPGSNALAAYPDSDDADIWAAIMRRLDSLPGYDTLFAAAFPDVARSNRSIVQVGNAIAAFVGTTWTTGGSPFDRFLLGDTLALTDAARRGAALFFGRARCGDCHRGPLLTDQLYHNIGLPVLGPGLNGGPDIGRAAVTGRSEDRYAFRTPPLRNVGLTAPYMHNGVYHTLEDAVRHYINPGATLATFDTVALDPRLRSTLDRTPATLADIRATMDPKVLKPLALSATAVADLTAFLLALTDPASGILVRDIPATVPSGLPIRD
jgi:cytochrome c peroxidase